MSDRWTQEDLDAIAVVTRLGGEAGKVQVLGRILAALDRIATALERANTNDPIDAINRALETMPEGDGADALASVPPEELWRLR